MTPGRAQTPRPVRRGNPIRGWRMSGPPPNGERAPAAGQQCHPRAAREEPTSVRPECRTPSRWTPERRHNRDRRAEAVLPVRRPPRRQPRRDVPGTRMRPSCHRKQRMAVFHVKQRRRSRVRLLGLCRTHAPSCPCLLGMGRHRGRPPRHRRAMRAVRREAATHTLRSPLGQHYRRAASLRPWGDRCHARPPDGARLDPSGRRGKSSRPQSHCPSAWSRRPTAQD
jgi:hypothetical protein